MTCLQLSSSIVVAKLKSHGDKMSEPDSMAHGFKQSRCRERVERRHKMTSHFPNFLRWPFFPPFFFHISRRQWGTLGWESMVNDNTKYCPAAAGTAVKMLYDVLQQLLALDIAITLVSCWLSKGAKVPFSNWIVEFLNSTMYIAIPHWALWFYG